ncbi:MAG: type II toxin-antitoxin system RelB/DinJ family antitoxin [Candidatus Caenarcaniphilales bacterium]|nr:type II toxin-antitoxin system RelB/DinJ family antitoxin [Candidatus Caenarcaniphilales bacterium]
MNKSAMIRARVNPELKEQVEEIFEQLGLNATEAITLFYKQVQLNHGIPFDLKIPNKVTRRTMQKTDLKKELHSYKSTEQMFESWDQL